jgi:hypothetical protein
MDQESLRLLIQHKIRNRRLPHDGIVRVWSSPSDGEMCDACDAVLARDQLLMEGLTLDLGRRPLPDASPPFRFGSRSLLLIAAKGDSMSVLVASEIPQTRG